MGNSESLLQVSRKDFEISDPLYKTTNLYKIWSSISQFPLVIKKQTRLLFVKEIDEFDALNSKNYIQNGIQQLKQLKHPSILVYFEDVVDKNQIKLFTEYALPLDLTIDKILFLDIYSGIIHILHALIFLHERARICHNNLNPSSIFVTNSGKWKVGSFECAQKIDNKLFIPSDFMKHVILSDFSSAEHLNAKNLPPVARDIFGFGKLLAYATSYAKEHLSNNQLTEITEIINRLTDANLKILNLRTLLNQYSSVFTNDLIEIMDFLDNIQLKDTNEKEEFFESIVEKLSKIPEEIIAKRLTTLCLSRYVMLDPLAHRQLIPMLLTLKTNDGLLNKLLYSEYVVKEVLRIFLVHEVAVRVALLDHFHRYVNYISVDILEDFLLNELLIGMKDTNGEIVSASLRAMAELVPILGPEKVTGLQHSKSFANGSPKTEIKNKNNPLVLSSFHKREEQREENGQEEISEFNPDSQPSEYSYVKSYSKEISINHWNTNSDWEENWDDDNSDIKQSDTVENIEIDVKLNTLLSMDEHVDLFAGMEPKIEKIPSFQEPFIVEDRDNAILDMNLTAKANQNNADNTDVKSRTQISSNNRKSVDLTMDETMVVDSNSWKPDDDDLVLDLEAD